MIKLFQISIVALLMSHSVAHSQDFNKGLSAWNAGDYETAFKEIQPLAQKGHGFSQFVLGMLYAGGGGVQKDDRMAAQWYARAAEQGIPQAQFNMGVIHSEGRGVTRDLKIAIYWYTLAAKQGEIEAQLNLAMLHGSGKGTRADPITSHMWMNISKQNGNARAVRGLDIIEEQLTADQIITAQRRALACMASDFQDCD